MKRMTLIAVSADEERILGALQDIQAVEIISSGETCADEESLDRAEERLARFSSAYSGLKPYAPKAGMGPKPECTAAQLREDLDSAQATVERTEELLRRLAAIGSEREKKYALIGTLEPWAEMDTRIEDIKNTPYVRYFTGLAEADELLRLEHVEEAAVEAFGQGRNCALLIACRSADAENILAALKNINYSEYNFPKLTGTPRENIVRLEVEIDELNREEKELEDGLREAALNVPLLARACDAAVIERDREAGKCELGATDATFIMEGWVRSDELDKIRDTVDKVTSDYYIDFEDPAEDEVPPSVLKNSKLVTPFESVINLYSKPDPRGIDGTALMAPFYFLFFGMMLSDSGYGIVLFLGCLAYLKLMKPTGMTKGIAQVLMYGGISTVVCGLFIGTFFGMDWNTFLGTPAGTFPLLFDPMTEPMGMLYLCFGLGIVHLLFGVAVKVWRCLRQGDWQGAIFDNLSWIMIVLGLVIFGGPMLLGMTVPSWVKVAGLAMSGAGALMVLVFAGRGKKLASRTISGLGKMYDITSYLSDILSYARVFALGLSTGVIGQVMNILGMMFLNAFKHGLLLQGIGLVITSALLVGLHLFNLGINTLGCFVHCARLQYVEFFGKFYDAGGRDFVPLGYKTRNVRVRG